MHEELNDPELTALEARLHACVPKMGGAEQLALALECGRIAGRQTARREVRRWQWATGGLVAIILAMVIPVSRSWDGNREFRPVANVTPRRTPEYSLPDVRLANNSPYALDAWQEPKDNISALAGELQFARSLDPALRTHTLTAAGRGWQTP